MNVTRHMGQGVTCLQGSKFLLDYYMKSQAHLPLLWDSIPGTAEQRRGLGVGDFGGGGVVGSPLHQTRRHPYQEDSLYRH